MHERPTLHLRYGAPRNEKRVHSIKRRYYAVRLLAERGATAQSAQDVFRYQTSGLYVLQVYSHDRYSGKLNAREEVNWLLIA